MLSPFGLNTAPARQLRRRRPRFWSIENTLKWLKRVGLALWSVRIQLKCVSCEPCLHLGFCFSPFEKVWYRSITSPG